jgi:hypothetical protein
MTRQGRRTTILVAVVVALGLAAIGETLRDRRNALRPLVDPAPRRVAEVALGCAQCTERRFRRIGGHWVMVAPWNVPADVESMERVLGLPATPVRRRFGSARVDPATLGLAPPFATVDLDALRIEFGTTDAIDNLRYVRVGDDVALVPDRVSVVLLAAPERFVDRRPFAGLPGGIAAVEEGDGAWDVDAQAALADWRAGDVVAAHFPAAAARMFTVVDGAGGRHRYALLAGEPARLARETPPLHYALPSGTALPVVP